MVFCCLITFGITGGAIAVVPGTSYYFNMYTKSFDRQILITLKGVNLKDCNYGFTRIWVVAAHTMARKWRNSVRMITKYLYATGPTKIVNNEH